MPAFTAYHVTQSPTESQHIPDGDRHGRRSRAFPRTTPMPAHRSRSDLKSSELNRRRLSSSRPSSSRPSSSRRGRRVRRGRQPGRGARQRPAPQGGRTIRQHEADLSHTTAAQRVRLGVQRLRLRQPHNGPALTMASPGGTRCRRVSRPARHSKRAITLVRPAASGRLPGRSRGHGAAARVECWPGRSRGSRRGAGGWLGSAGRARRRSGCVAGPGARR